MKKIVDVLILDVYRAYTPDGTLWVETVSMTEFLREFRKWDRKKGDLKTYKVSQKQITYAPKTKKVHLLGKKCRNCGHPKSDHNMFDDNGDFFCAPYHTGCNCQMYTREKKDA